MLIVYALATRRYVTWHIIDGLVMCVGFITSFYNFVTIGRHKANVYGNYYNILMLIMDGFEPFCFKAVLIICEVGL